MENNENWDDDFNHKVEIAKRYPLLELFKKYNLNINKFNNKITCPFPFHKNGREKTSSFFYYDSTNTYWCFGCKSGSTPIDFVKNIESIPFNIALNKLINLSGNYKAKPIIVSNDNYKLYTEKSIEFANYIRKLLKNDDTKILGEEVQLTFDTLNKKYEMDENKIIFLIEKLMEKCQKKS
ncbi:MAG: hypothetical protein LC122_12720 [Chitinophagales bacterium]|nr:hypothetical protein [Chitinophagales bacterium]